MNSFECECLKGCIFFNDQMKDKPKEAEMIKRRFCKNDNTFCARYIIFKNKGKGNVPADLYPHNIKFAYQIINTV